MAWFHDKDGNASNWREGKFDPTHLWALLVILTILAWAFFAAGLGHRAAVFVR